MKAKPIPEKSRRLVYARDRERCVRCGMQTNLQWHHRRSRSIRDEHVHCPANGVALCLLDHQWAHRYPELARASGLIVPRHADPHEVPFLRWDKVWVAPDCDGGWTEAQNPFPVSVGPQ